MEKENKIVGFFRKLRNGDFGLFKTYWIYTVGIGFLSNIVSKIIDESDISGTGFIIYGLIISAYGYQVILGLWRASKRYEGRKIWSVLGKIAAVLSSLWLVITILLLLSYLISTFIHNNYR